MVEEGSHEIVDAQTAENWLARAQELVLAAIEKAKAVKPFAGRWNFVISKLERIPSTLSDMSSHPCFSKNTLCREQLESLCKTLSEAIELAGRCAGERCNGKLQMQSDLDALSSKLDFSLRDCWLLVKTGVLGEATLPLSLAVGPDSPLGSVRELLARLQIGHVDAKHEALNGLIQLIEEDEKKNVLALLSSSNISALIHLLTVTSPKTRERAALAICLIAESSSCSVKVLVSLGALSPLIRMVESGTVIGKEKATITLQRLSMAADAARLIVGLGGIGPLINIAQRGESVSQAAAVGTLKNLSALPELRQNLADQGIIGAMIGILESGILLVSKEYAAECLQNLTACNENLRRAVIWEGGVSSLLAYIDAPLPQETSVGALRNLVGSISKDGLVSLRVLPRLVHALKAGSLGAQQAAASAVCEICNSKDKKKLVGELGFIPFLVNMLEAKTNSARETAAQALCSLLSIPGNCQEIKKNEKSVPSLVQLLDPSPHNTAKKYAVSCLTQFSSIRKCRRVMISYGAIGYLKKLCDMDIPGAKKLLEQLERGKLQSLFKRNQK